MKPMLFAVIFKSGEADTKSTSLSAGEAAIANFSIKKKPGRSTVGLRVVDIKSKNTTS